MLAPLKGGRELHKLVLSRVCILTAHCILLAFVSCLVQQRDSDFSQPTPDVTGTETMKDKFTSNMQRVNKGMQLA